MFRLTIFSVLLCASMASAVDVAPGSVPQGVVIPNADHFARRRGEVDVQMHVRQVQIDAIAQERRHAVHEFRATRARLGAVQGFAELEAKHQAYLDQLSAMQRQLEDEKYDIEMRFDPMY